MHANILSFGEVEDAYKITYIRKESFTVHLPDQDTVFRRRGKLYVADFWEYGYVHAVRGYTKEEEERAKTAYDLVRTSGYSLYQEDYTSYKTVM
jgi:hypothetical protein